MGVRHYKALITILAASAGLIAVFALAIPNAVARDTNPSEKTTYGNWVGASVAHPERWFVERERNTYDETFGFVLWDPEKGALEDHGGVPVLRVARAPEIEPGRIRQTVEEKISEYPDLSLERQKVAVGENGLEGTAVGPIPGAIPSTEIYVPVNGRVYQINVYSKGLDEKDRELLSDIRFYKPSRSMESLGLEEAAEDPDPNLITQPNPEANSKEAVFSAQGSAQGTGDKKIYEGCWRADRNFFVRVPYGRGANSAGDDGIRKGWSVAGRPNYWGQSTHGGLDYGRCNKSAYTNDKFAVDYPLNRGDRVYSPFKRGTVVFAGRNLSHIGWGRMVVIKTAKGKYVSLSAHLSSIPSNIRPGKVVDKNTVIGYAGDSANPSRPTSEVHLHQAFYRYPSYNPDGSPYGGASLRVDRLRYGGLENEYKLGRVEHANIFCKAGMICGEGHYLKGHR